MIWVFFKWDKTPNYKVPRSKFPSIKWRRISTKFILNLEKNFNGKMVVFVHFLTYACKHASLFKTMCPPAKLEISHAWTL
jgi:hypothetical protein